MRFAGYPEFLSTAGNGSPNTPLASALIAARTPNAPDTLALPLTFKNGIVNVGATPGGIVNPLY
jgi:hypothetical protein